MQQKAERYRIFGRRALLLGAAELGLFGLLGGRLWQLQVQDTDRYRLLAENNRVSQRLVVPPRGRILDRHGRPLAQNVPIYRVRVVREQTKDLRRTLEVLAELIPIEPKRVEDVLNQAMRQRAFVPISVREDLTYDEVSTIAVNSPALPGVLLDAGLHRHYPESELLSHILGYIGPPSRDEVAADEDPLLRLPEFRIGKNGIERAYDKELRGRSGIYRVEVNSIGREIRELERTDGEHGHDLRLSIDLDLQRYCFERLTESQAASAVVLEVATGAVRAMVSVPSFDPAVFTNGLTSEVWRSLRDDPRHPLVNKSIRGQYPPGSTFKMITALAALEAGVITHTTEVFCPGHLSLGNARFHCWRAGGHGRMALVPALAQSCDVYFYDVARRVGVDAIAAMAGRFGLGEPLGIDLPGEQGGLVPTSEWKKQRFGVPWQRGETVIVGIGQGYLTATPLQLAVMTARLCNGGKEVHPWFVEGDRAHVAEGRDAPAASLGLKEANLRWVLQGMHDVIHGGRGTARAAALPLEGVLMGGKTGTAQVRRITKAERASGAHKRKDRPWKDRDHALFVCFAPFEAPRYAVSVIVEHGESGSKTAGPIARDIMARALEIDRAPLLGSSEPGATRRAS
jgi:penicillin-binding protein 2